MALTDDDAYDANGVDRTLIRKLLALTPAERARTHDRLLADVERLAAAGRVARDRRCGVGEIQYTSRVRFRELDVEVDRHALVARRDGCTVATGRWTGSAIEDRSGDLTPAGWRELEAAIAADEAAALEQADASAQDAEGVDVTLIDWMLSLTPTERLRVLMRHATELAGFVRDDLRE